MYINFFIFYSKRDNKTKLYSISKDEYDSRYHFCKFFLKTVFDGDSLIRIGSLFHNIAPVYLADLIPNWVVLILCKKNVSFGNLSCMVLMNGVDRNEKVLKIGKWLTFHAIIYKTEKL